MSQQNEQKLSTKQKMTIANVFRKILHRFVKSQFQQIKQLSRLRNQILGLIILYFHIYNLSRNLYQLTKHNTICFLSHLKVSRHLWWYHSRALFLSKWSGSQACPPVNTNPFRCQIALESVMGAGKVSLIATGIIPKYHYPAERLTYYGEKHIWWSYVQFWFPIYVLSRDHVVRKNPNSQNNSYVMHLLRLSCILIMILN